MASPRRGEVWLVDLGMTAKVRPALVVSVPAADTDRALVTVVPHTTSPRQSQFEAEVTVGFLRAGVFDAQNLITIPHAKLVRQLANGIRLNSQSSKRRCVPGWDCQPDWRGLTPAAPDGGRAAVCAL
jgi:mRNA interferase MazF